MSLGDVAEVAPLLLVVLMLVLLELSLSSSLVVSSTLFMAAAVHKKRQELRKNKKKKNFCARSFIGQFVRSIDTHGVVTLVQHLQRVKCLASQAQQRVCFFESQTFSLTTSILPTGDSELLLKKLNRLSCRNSCNTKFQMELNFLSQFNFETKK